MAKVLARVRHNNNYGGDAPAGAVVEVESEELALVPWCLEALPPEEEHKEESASTEEESSAEASTESTPKAEADQLAPPSKKSGRK